jgi:hypothetical protein
MNTLTQLWKYKIKFYVYIGEIEWFSGRLLIPIFTHKAL